VKGCIFDVVSRKVIGNIDRSHTVFSSCYSNCDCNLYHLLDVGDYWSESANSNPPNPIWCPRLGFELQCFGIHRS